MYLSFSVPLPPPRTTGRSTRARTRTHYKGTSFRAGMTSSDADRSVYPQVLHIQHKMKLIKR